MFQDVKQDVVHETERIRVHMGLKEPTQMEERIEYFDKYLNSDREFFARARKAVLSDPFPPELRVEYEEAMDRVDDLLVRLGHKTLPREKYRHVPSQLPYNIKVQGI